MCYCGFPLWALVSAVSRCFENVSIFCEFSPVPILSFLGNLGKGKLFGGCFLQWFEVSSTFKVFLKTLANFCLNRGSKWSSQGKSGWLSGYQLCLPPVRPGLNSWPRDRMGWVSVDLNLTPKGFSPGTPVFLPHQNRLTSYSIRLWCCAPRSYMGRVTLFFHRNKRKCLHENRAQFPLGLVGYTNMATVPLFRDTNMTAVTSCENTL